MAEVGRDLPDRGPALEHVGGVAVAKGVNAEDLVLFAEAALRFREMESSPNARLTHGLGM